MGGNQEEIPRFRAQVPVYGIEESTSSSPAHLRSAGKADSQPGPPTSSDPPAAVRNHRGLHTSGFLYSRSRVPGQVFTDRRSASLDKFSLWPVRKVDRHRLLRHASAFRFSTFASTEASRCDPDQLQETRTIGLKRTSSAQVVGSWADLEIVASRREDSIDDEAHRSRIVSGSRICPPSGMSRSRKISPIAIATGISKLVTIAAPPGWRTTEAIK